MTRGALTAHSLISAAVLALACGIGSGSLAAPPKGAVNPTDAASVTPKLAPGVKPQAGYEPAKGRWVVANPTPIFSDIMETSAATGHTGEVGAPVNAIAKVKDYDWFVVGSGGEGIGYVPRDLLKPAGGARS